MLSDMSSLIVIYAKLKLLTYVYILLHIYIVTQKRQESPSPFNITSNRNNVLFNTTANPLIPSWWVSWASITSSWWDNKVWNIFWYPFLRQTFPETTHTANCIARFWIRGCFWFWRPFNKFSSRGKMIGFLTEIRRSFGYQIWVCQVGVTAIKEGTFSSSIYSVLYESKQMEGMHRLLSDHFCWRASLPRLPGSGFQE